MTEIIYKEPEEYKQRPFVRKNILRILTALNKSGILTRQLEIQGLENISQLDEPAVIAPNHRSNGDVLLNGIMFDKHTDREIFFAGKEKLWQSPTLAKLYEAIGGFPVNRHGGGAEHFMKVGSYLLEHGSHVVVYPEGTRKKSEIIETKLGAAMLSTMVEKPIIPVGQYGTEDLYNPRKRFPVSVIIGEPIYPDDEIRQDQLSKGYTAENARYATAQDLNSRLAMNLQGLVDTARRRYKELQ